MWIRDCPRDKNQRAVLDVEASDWLSMTSGIPQGSVLGPRLCIIHISVLETRLTSKISNFAEDTYLENKAQIKKDCIMIKRNVTKLM